jgi:hypothetical protein
MSAAEKAALVTGLTQAVYDLARAGVRHRYPEASPREVFHMASRSIEICGLTAACMILKTTDYGVCFGPAFRSIAASTGPITSSTDSVIAPAMIARRY